MLMCEFPMADGKLLHYYCIEGKTYEVAWALQANHGGGYSYRLCTKGGLCELEDTDGGWWLPSVSSRGRTPVLWMYADLRNSDDSQ